MKTKPMRKPRPPTDAEVERMAEHLFTHTKDEVFGRDSVYPVSGTLKMQSDMVRRQWRCLAREALRLGAKLPKRGKK